MHGNIHHAELPGRQEPSVARYEAARFVDQARVRPTELTDAARDLRHLGGGMRPSVARVGDNQVKRAEALGLLAPIYAWFTEGLDAPDLIEAKALLMELAGN
jgi:hypothetical protein